jgi:hypothetical protein
MTISEFWAWFSAEEPRLLASDPKEVTGEIEDRVRELDPRIGVELGDAVVRELIFTVYVQIEAFTLVKELVAAAPRFERWRMIALKPARGFDFSIDVAGRKVDASSITFEPLDSPAMPGAIGIRCFVDDALASNSNRGGILRLIVATGIGEEAAARISHIEVAEKRRAPAEPIRIVALREYIDWHDHRTLKN